MVIAFSIAFIAALYFYSRYQAEKKQRFIDALQREMDASTKEINRMIAASVAEDLANGLTIEESADKHADLINDIESLRGSSQRPH